MDFQKREQVIRHADRFAPANPPARMCTTCDNSHRLTKSAADMRSWLECQISAAEIGQLNLAGLVRVNKLFDQWLVDGTIPCPDCGVWYE